MKLFNTLTREIEELRPIEDDLVKIYSCGPTVYDYPHIGNLRSYLFADLLKRSLLFVGYKVKHVINITDVGHLTSQADTGEDKMEKSAREKGKSALEIAEFFTTIFKKNLVELQILDPEIWSKATDYIPEMVDWIKKLEEKGFTYIIENDGVYYDTSKFPDYPKLAKLNLEGLQSGKRVEDVGKKNPTDFALWKFSPKDEQRQMEWDSPWGMGFPGWHIECTAMATKHLGEHFDIHTGGIDHIPVHHSNEIAQAEPIVGKPWVNFWMHNEFLVLDKDTKMSKSAGNFQTLDSLKEYVEPLAFRYLFLQTHYRKPLAFTMESLKQAAVGLDHLRDKIKELLENQESAGDASLYMKQFTEAINQDLNVTQALGIVWTMLKDQELGNKEKYDLLMKFDAVLGLDLNHITVDTIPQEILNLVKEREEARTQKDFAASDKLRDAIAAKGYVVKDTPEGPKVTVKTS